MSARLVGEFRAKDASLPTRRRDDQSGAPAGGPPRFAGIDRRARNFSDRRDV
jgi:hypothetical protein